MYLFSECLPKDALRAYFGCHEHNQEHFDLKNFISICHSNSQQLHMLHVRSDSCSQSLPTWLNIVYENPSHVEIHHLGLLKSESSVRSIIDSWVSSGVDCFILVVDMQLQQSAKLVNFVRAFVEQEVNVEQPKKFMLLLHYPLSGDKPSYPALFLGNWQCAYLDGIGYTSSRMSVNNVFEAACFDDCALDEDKLLNALLPKAVQYVASQVPFYSRSPHPQSVNQDMQFTERLIKIESIMNRQIKGVPLAKLLCRNYLSMWTKDAIREMLHRSAIALRSAITHLAISTAIGNTFQHTFMLF